MHDYSYLLEKSGFDNAKSISPFHSALPHEQIAHVHEQLDKARAELDAVKLSVEQQKRDLLRASFA